MTGSSFRTTKDSLTDELYQQVILEHNKKPQNFHQMEDSSHSSEGYNPVCGDHLWVYLMVKGIVISDISFQGEGCAISKASASMMTIFLKGKTAVEATALFQEFQKMIKGQLNPTVDPNQLGKLRVFAGIWQFPARVKCAILAWHTMNGALQHVNTVTTE